MGLKYRIVEDEFAHGKFAVQSYDPAFEAWLTDWIFLTVDDAEEYINDCLKESKKPKDPRLGKVYE